MANYRKKPVVIEAFQWTGDINQTEDPVWIVEGINKKEVWFIGEGTENVIMQIETLEGIMTANRGDYIIKGIQGELYPCKTDIFEASYEHVNALNDTSITLTTNVNLDEIINKFSQKLEEELAKLL